MDGAHLDAVLYYAELATQFVEGWTPESDEIDDVRFLAISCCLSIIGGAACNISHAAVPVAGREQWPGVMALRDRMREYRSVTPRLLSAIVQRNLPPLIAALKSMPEARQ
jgi:uncharacterized protein with HEPN domain